MVDMQGFILRTFHRAALFLFLLAGCSAPVLSTPGTPPLERSIPQVSPPVASTVTDSPSPPPPATSTPNPYFTPSATPRDATQTPTPLPAFRFCSPLAEHTLKDLEEILTNPFNPPPPGKDGGHHGVDFAYYRRGDRLSILGVPVDSVMAGQVAAAIQNRIPYGNMVIVETSVGGLPEELVRRLKIPAGQSLYLLYAHMNAAPRVEIGQDLECGQALSEVGNTPKGWSSDPHLHLEVRIGPPGAVFEGMVFYDTGATLQEMENYRRWRMSGEFQMIDPMALLRYGLAVR
jgi:murein DD-endopeptidase MepM/ murein hydrolase activator NlpD